MSGRLVTWLRRNLARFAPRCIVIVIFGDGSFVAAKLSRIERAQPRIEIESRNEHGASRSACELVVNFGSVRIYRLVRQEARTWPASGVSTLVN